MPPGNPRGARHRRPCDDRKRPRQPPRSGSTRRAFLRASIAAPPYRAGWFRRRGSLVPHEDRVPTLDPLLVLVELIDRDRRVELRSHLPLAFEVLADAVHRADDVARSHPDRRVRRDHSRLEHRPVERWFHSEDRFEVTPPTWPALSGLSGER